MTHYIYLPGFGERFDLLRRLALRRWERSDVRVTVVTMRWTDRSETYEQRYERVAKVVKQSSSEKVVLVGESGSGPMALLAFSRHPEAVDSVVTICGYNHGASDVHQMHRRQRPAFYALMQTMDTIVPTLPQSVRRRITTIYSTHDKVVTPDHTRIEGAREVVLSTGGHMWSICRTLLKGLE